MRKKFFVITAAVSMYMFAIESVYASDFFASVARLKQSPLEMPTAQTFKNFAGIEFVRIEPGTFTMGYEGGELGADILNATEHGGRDIRLELFGKEGDYDEKPAHKVTISKPFYMGVCEVTNEQYEKFDPLHMYLRGKHGFSIDSDEAVVFVSWHEAKAFCDWMSDIDGLAYRLPTEAEWEYACRAGTKARYWAGDAVPEEFVKNPDNSWYPCPARGRGREEVVALYVRRTEPNPWGLYDTHGNIEEWCHDWYGPYEAAEQRDPVGRIDGSFKVTRGGSHGTVAYYLRSANRSGTLPEDKSFIIGFRVVIRPSPGISEMLSSAYPVMSPSALIRISRISADRGIMSRLPKARRGLCFPGIITTRVYANARMGTFWRSGIRAYPSGAASWQWRRVACAAAPMNGKRPARFGTHQTATTMPRPCGTTRTGPFITSTVLPWRQHGVILRSSCAARLTTE